MNKISFFKLPLLLTFFYGLISLLAIFIMNGQRLAEIDTTIFIIDAFFNDIFTELLLVFLVSSVVFFRYQIVLCTIKNTVLVLLIALLLYVLTYPFYSLIFSTAYEFIFRYFYSFSSSFYRIAYNILSTIIIYLLIGKLLYYIIVILSNNFKASVINVELINSSRQLAKIHLVLYILLLLFISSALYRLFFLLGYYSLSYGSIYYYIINSIIFIASILILYFILKNSFSGQFYRIELAKLIKCVICSYLFSALASVIMGIILSFILVFIFSSLDYSRYQIEKYVFVSILLIQIVVTCIIMQVVTRHYFGNKEPH